MRAQKFVVLLAGAALSSACGKSDTLPLGTSLSVPSSAAFGDVPIGKTKNLTLTLTNLTNEASAVLRIEAGASFDGRQHIFRVTDLPTSVPANGSAEMTISFEAFAAMEQSVTSSFKVISARGENLVEVSGRGIQAVNIRPDRLNFGEVLRGESSRKSIFIDNLLDEGITLRRAGMLEKLDGAGTFELIGDPSTDILAEIGPGGTTELEIVYTAPSAWTARSDRARLTVAYCPSPICEARIELTGSPTDEGLRCSMQNIDFGNVPDGVTETRTFTCSAPGSAVNVETAELRGLGVQNVVLRLSNDVPFQLETNQSFDVTVAWTASGGDLESTLEIAGRYAAGEERIRSQQISLRGRQGDSRITVSPTDIDFGVVAVGTSVTRTIRLENLGTRDTNVHLAPDTLSTGQFFISLPENIIVPGGSWVDVPVSFQPSVDGVSRSETLIDDQLSAVVFGRVQLTGAGIVLDPCVFRASSQANFGQVEPLRERFTTVLFENTGTEDCLFRDFALTGAGASHFTMTPPNGEIFLPSGRSLELEIEYRPTTIGAHRADLEYYVSTASGDHRLPVEGEGRDSFLTVFPDRVDFGNVELTCNSQVRKVRVHNPNNSFIWSESILSPDTSPEFQVTHLFEGLNPGSSEEITIRYVPTDAGSDRGELIIREQNGVGGIVVPLFGNGDNTRTLEKTRQYGSGKMDILLVAERGVGMAQELDQLVIDMRPWLEDATAAGIDYQLSVLTMNIASSSPCQSDFNPPGNMSNGDCAYFAATSAHPEYSVIDPTERPTPRDAFEALMSIPMIEGGFPQGMLASRYALRAPRTLGWNAGFLRPGAALTVLFVSNQDDYGSDPIANFADELLSIHGVRNRNQVTAHAITGDPVVGCFGGSGSGTPGTKLIELAQRTGGTFASICAASYPMPVEMLGYRSKFFLENTPANGVVEVRIDGFILPNISPGGQENWVYSESDNSVVFHPLAIPELGTEIEFRFDTICE